MKKKTKNIYCIFCGTKNDSKNEFCKKCNKTLTPQDHLWIDYFKGHVKDKLKGCEEDKVSSIITNYIISHLTGIAFSVLFVATIIHGVTNITKEDYSYIKEVTESPSISAELALDDESVIIAQKFLKQDYLKKFPTGFYEKKKMTYDDLQEKRGMTFEYIYDYKKLKELQIIFNNCEEAKDYPDIYALCNWDSSYVVGDDAGARDYYLFDANDFEKEYKKLYGNDKILEKENFKVHSIYECSYYEKSDKYICHTLETGWATDAAEFTKLVKAEKINNQLILYDYYVWVTPDGTYKDYKETRKISDKLVTDNIWNNEEFKNEELFEQGQLYKHVFKSNGNGEYYWYSSEPVDDLED